MNINSLDWKPVPFGIKQTCFVGSGECFADAVWCGSDGGTGFVYVCDEHRQLMDDLCKILDTPSARERLKRIIEDETS